MAKHKSTRPADTGASAAYWALMGGAHSHYEAGWLEDWAAKQREMRR